MEGEKEEGFPIHFKILIKGELTRMHRYDLATSQERERERERGEGLRKAAPNERTKERLGWLVVHCTAQLHSIFRSFLSSRALARWCARGRRGSRARRRSLGGGRLRGASKAVKDADDVSRARRGAARSVNSFGGRSNANKNAFALLCRVGRESTIRYGRVSRSLA